MTTSAMSVARSDRTSSAIQRRKSEMTHSHLRLRQMRPLAGGYHSTFIDHDRIASFQTAAQDLDRGAVVDASDHLNLAESLALENPEAGRMVVVSMRQVVIFARAVGREAQRLQRHFEHVFVLCGNDPGVGRHP